MKRILISIGSAALAPLLFWIGGFDFDRRGEGALCCALLTIMIAGLVYYYPGWSE